MDNVELVDEGGPLTPEEEAQVAADWAEIWGFLGPGDGEYWRYFTDGIYLGERGEYFDSEGATSYPTNFPFAPPARKS